MEIEKIVLLVNNPASFNRFQLSSWHLQHLYIPRKLQDFDTIELEVLDLVANGNQTDSYVLTSNSVIITVAKQYRLVLVIDTSMSMKSTDGKVLSSIAFETACKTLRGLCQPFHITHSLTNKVTEINPKLVVTIIGDGCCDLHFRVFVHHQPVDVQNLLEIAEIVYCSITEFENETLDASKDTSYPTIELHTNIQQSNLRFLDLGLNALRLLPLDSLPIIIYITDGVSTTHGSSIPRELCRRVAKHYINFGIIQVGSGLGFTPTVSLGHIPNQEFMKFLADATAGFFLYSDDCPYIDETSTVPNIYHKIFSMKVNQLATVTDHDGIHKIDFGLKHRFDIHFN
ncbi:hypothetical protein BC833DRAFT_3886 [Globomyces pollinis-pini]|nr:hypothetical protein BC833DRAFT_3886 [Globomyces pollinis-pini]